MITIEGGSGKGSMWSVPYKLPLAYIPDIDIRIYVEGRILQHMSPFETYFPRDATAGLYHNCEDSVYGPRSFGVEVGELISAPRSTTYNPCQHSTINGAVRWHGASDEQHPYLGTISSSSPVPIYLGNGVLGVYPQGFTTRKTASRTAYGLDSTGNEVKISPTTSNTPLWNNLQRYPADWDPRYIPSILNPGQGLVTSRDPYFCDVVDPNNFFPGGPFCWVRNYVVRTGQNTWHEVLLKQYCHNTSFHYSDMIPPKSLGFEGYGYTVAYARWDMEHTMVGIRKNRAGDFTALYRSSQDVNYGGWTSEYPRGKFKSGQFHEELMAEVQLMPVYPGLTEEAKFDPSGATAYCSGAKERARLLRSDKSASIARSNALADVTALDSNWIENLSQVKGAMDVVKPLLSGYRAFRCGDINEARKALAGAYLSYKYAINPTIHDVRDIKDNIQNVSRSATVDRYANERRRGGYHEYGIPVLGGQLAQLDYHTVFHLVLKDSSFAAVWSALDRLGLDPSVDNIWDLIPFSFVADWFTSIGSSLTKIADYNNSVVTRDLVARIESFKAQWPVPECDNVLVCPTGFVPSGAPLVYSWYDRDVSRRFGKVDPFAGQSNSGLSVNQMIQGAALVSSY